MLHFSKYYSLKAIKFEQKRWQRTDTLKLHLVYFDFMASGILVQAWTRKTHGAWKFALSRTGSTFWYNTKILES